MRFHRLQVVRRVPHPARGFTQGLVVDGSMVWESTGYYGRSALRRYELGMDGGEVADGTVIVDGTVIADGAVIVDGAEATDGGEIADGMAAAAWSRLPPDLFGEGICRVGDSIWQLTWRERVALRWDAARLHLRERVPYNREGWGMCTVVAPPAAGPVSAVEVVTSDGSSELVRRDPETLEPRAVVQVRCQGERVRGLNDLTWAGGLVWANIAGTDCLAGIDLEAAEITDVVDARKAAERHWRDPQAMMNGIAALWQPGEFLLTGKGWRSIRQVRLIPDRDRGHIDRVLSGVSR